MGVVRPILVAIIMVAPSVAIGASFNCSKASTSVEKTICAGKALSSLDEQLAKTYESVILSSDHPDVVKRHQKDWLRNIRDKCRDETCLKSAYEHRLAQLAATKPAEWKTFRVTDLGIEFSYPSHQEVKVGCRSSKNCIALIGKPMPNSEYLMAFEVFDGDLEKIAVEQSDNYLDAIRQGETLLKNVDITTPLRMAHFLAQALHETGGFCILRESMDYSAKRMLEIFGVGHHSAAVTAAEADKLAHDQEAIAERVYGLGNSRKARELGNTKPGDGFLYRGNGILQTTGRGNHKRMGAGAGVDFEGDPDLVTDSAHALKPALTEWTQNNLNAFADKNDIRTMTRKINGGFNGLREREAWFGKVWVLLKAVGDPAEAWEIGGGEEDVKQLQEALNALGADPKLVVDGRNGPKTEQAVREFQAAAGLKVDGISGPVTEAAIKLRLDTIRGA